MECVSVSWLRALNKIFHHLPFRDQNLKGGIALSCTTVQGICTIAVNIWVFVVSEEGRVSQYDSGQMSKAKLNEVQHSPKAHTADSLEDADWQPS